MFFQHNNFWDEAGNCRQDNGEKCLRKGNIKTPTCLNSCDINPLWKIVPIPEIFKGKIFDFFGLSLY
jgi:hypothetical protein